MMPEIRQQDPHAGFSTQDNSNNLAICCLVFGYGGTIQASPRQPDTYPGDGGQVYQVDRSEADTEV